MLKSKWIEIYSYKWSLRHAYSDCVYGVSILWCDVHLILPIKKHAKCKKGFLLAYTDWVALPMLTFTFSCRAFIRTLFHFGKIRAIGNQKPIEFNKLLTPHEERDSRNTPWTYGFNGNEKFIEQTNLHSWTEHLFTFYLFLILIYSHKFCFILQVIDGFFLIPWNHRMI